MKLSFLLFFSLSGDDDNDDDSDIAAAACNDNDYIADDGDKHYIADDVDDLFCGTCQLQLRWSCRPPPRHLFPGEPTVNITIEIWE